MFSNCSPRKARLPGRRSTDSGRPSGDSTAPARCSGSATRREERDLTPQQFRSGLFELESPDVPVLRPSPAAAMLIRARAAVGEVRHDFGQWRAGHHEIFRVRIGRLETVQDRFVHHEGHRPVVLERGEGFLMIARAHDAHVQMFLGIQAA